MLSVKMFLEDDDSFLHHTDPDENGNSRTYLFNRGNKEVVLDPSQVETEKKTIPNPDKSWTASKTKVVDNQYNTPQRSLVKNEFGETQIARQIPGGKVTYQNVDDYLKSNGMTQLPQNMKNAEELLNSKLGLTDRAKFMANRGVDWIDKNRVPAGIMALGGTYIALSNRDKMKNFINQRRLM